MMNSIYNRYEFEGVAIMVKNLRKVKEVSIITVLGNIILSFLKVALGIYGKSQALVSDGIHSILDVVTTIIAFLGIKASQKESDDCHPYGHEKIEAIIGKIMATILFITALFIGYRGLTSIIKKDFSLPNTLTIYIAIISIIVKEWMFRLTIKVAEEVNSSSLKADAWHHRSDSYSSMATLVGILGARMGLLFLDPLVSIFICLLISKIAIDIYIQSVKELIDTCADSQIQDKIKFLILEIEGVKEIDKIQTRLHGSKVYADIEISVDKYITVYEGHEIAHNVHDNVENNIEKIKHCNVHVNPY